MLRVAVDFGTSSTCTAVSVDGRAPQVVVVDGAPLLPSAVCVTADGTLFVGHEADRQAALDPSRYEPHPKRRIDEPELLLGDTVLPVVGVIRAVLRRALLEARHLAGGANVDQLVLTHPADWGAARTQKLRRSAHGLASELVLVPEPVAAAVFHSQGHAVPPDGCLAVLDLGGGTVDASVVRRVTGGFRVLATRGDPTFGGADIDQALLEYVGAQVAGEDAEAWRQLVEGRELADRRRRRVLRQDVRGAKETLSRHTYTDVPMPPPFPDAHVTRDDLERLIAAPLQRTVALLQETVAAAAVRPEHLVGVFLVGGSSRIPMVSRLLYERLGVLPVTLDQPETVVARGALHAVLQLAPGSLAVPPEGPAGGRPGPPATEAGRAIPIIGGPAASGPITGNYPAGGQAPGHPGRQPAGRSSGGYSAGGHAAGQAGGGYPAVGATTGGHLAGVPPGPPARSTGTALVPPRSARRRRIPWLVAGAVLAVAAAGIALTVALIDDGSEQWIAEYHYRFTVPDGWQHAGGDPATRRVDVAPEDASAVPDRIFVTEAELGYNADADRERAVSELRRQYESGRLRLDRFDPSVSFAGRDVLYYTESVDAGTVDWYVVFGGRFQVSVGCQHDEAGAERVRTACERVVGTLSI